MKRKCRHIARTKKGSLINQVWGSLAVVGSLWPSCRAAGGATEKGGNTQGGERTDGESFLKSVT